MEEESLERLLSSASPSASQKLKKALTVALAEHNSPNVSPEELRTRLQSRFNSFKSCHEFREGELVRWKEGLRNRSRPGDDEYGIVVEILDSPVIAHEHESGTPYFREPLDLVVGILDSDGDFICFHFDSRRFELVN